MASGFGSHYLCLGTSPAASATEDVLEARTAANLDANATGDSIPDLPVESAVVHPRSKRVYEALYRFACDDAIHPHYVGIDVRRLADCMGYGDDHSRAAKDIKQAVMDGIVVVLERGKLGHASRYALRGQGDTYEETREAGKARMEQDRSKGKSSSITVAGQTSAPVYETPAALEKIEPSSETYTAESLHNEILQDKMYLRILENKRNGLVFVNGDWYPAEERRLVT
jgi:hypothetical protein